MIHENQQQQIRLIQSNREIVKYPCDKFDYEATTQSNLTTHIQSKHEGGVISVTINLQIAAVEDYIFRINMKV